MDVSDPNSINTDLCQLCSLRPRKYTCPRCSAHYCSVVCYKSSSHLSCSEEFYKKCVEDEMKTQSDNPENRRKMIEILKRFHTELNFDVFNYECNGNDTLNYQDGSDESIDSDDDNEVPDLSERVANIDLNNADDVWTVLTNAEKQEFEAIIRNCDEESLLPQWTPWWSKSIDNKLIEMMSEQENVDYVANCPQIVGIAPMNAVEKASPLMCYNLLNILNAYVVMVLHYNGEHESSDVEAVAFFLQLNDVIGGYAIFEDASSAFTAVLNKAIEYELILENSNGMTIMNSIKQIIQGPCEKYRTYYTASALSDLHKMFTKVKNTYRAARERNLSSSFPRKLKSGLESIYSKLTKKHLQLCIKKIEYYMAWNDKCGMRMHDLDLNGVKRNDIDFE